MELQYKLFTLFTLIILSLFSLRTKAQDNLVLNPSFEEVFQCPDERYQFEGYTKHWLLGQNAPSYFHYCGLTGAVQLPNLLNIAPQIVPKDGEAVAGIRILRLSHEFNTDMITGKLSSNLKKNELYFGTFYVYPAYNHTTVYCLSDGVGLAFTNEPYNNYELAHFETFIPELDIAFENPSGNILNDSTQWTRVCGFYRAKGGETNITIGNLRPHEETTFICTGGGAALLFIDEVGVYPVSLWQDTMMRCHSGGFSIENTFLDAEIRWSGGISQAGNHQFSDPGNYTVEIDMGACIYRDTITIIDPYQVVRDIPNAYTFCSSDVEKTIGVTNLPGNYAWTTGAQSRTIDVQESGVYTLTIETECGIITKDFEVNIEECDCRVFAPNALMPGSFNGNEIFRIYVNCDFEAYNFHFSIYDRWGKQIHHQASIAPVDLIWDGKSNGNSLPGGVYVWSLQFNYLLHGREYSKTANGTVVLLR